MDHVTINQPTVAAKATRYLEWAVKLLVVLTPLAYLSGRHFIEGYLNAFGLDDALIRISIEDALLWSVWSLFSLIRPLLSALRTIWALPIYGNLLL